MLMSSMLLSLRAIGERWDVSLGGGVMWYWTLGVHLTEKNLDPGGAPLRNTSAQRIVYTSRAQHFHETDKHLFAKGRWPSAKATARGGRSTEAA